MKSLLCLIGLLCLLGGYPISALQTVKDEKITSSSSSAAAEHPIPRISWLNQPVRAMPLVQNFVVATNLCGSQHFNETGFIGMSPITAAPFTANFQNSTIYFDGQVERVTHVTWGVCEGIRESPSGGIRNIVRMPFNRRIILQQWQMNASASSNSNSGIRKVDMWLDGPYARRCDQKTPRTSYTSSCGWGMGLPIGRDYSHGPEYNFIRTVTSKKLPGFGNVTVVIAEDKLTYAATVTYLLVTDSNGMYSEECSSHAANNISAWLGPDHTWHSDPQPDFGFGFNASLNFPVGKQCKLWMAIAMNHTKEEAEMDLTETLTGGQGKNIDTVFDTACNDWQGHFDKSFVKANDHFSGNLPTLETDDDKIRAVYEWSLVAMVSLERIGYPSFPRQFVISDGPSAAQNGASNEGGSGQFIWDLSFAATSYTLLDPEWARNLLSHVTANAGFIYNNDSTVHGRMALAQCWDSYVYSPIGAGIYCFDYIATFLFVQTYVTYSGDYDWLLKTIPQDDPGKPSGSPLEMLKQIAWSWTTYPRSIESPYLVDYGSNKRDFLEAAGTYTDVIPALQGANAGMMFSVANLLEIVGKKNPSMAPKFEEEIRDLRGNATAVIEDMIKYQYVQEKTGDGAWQCLKDQKGVSPSVVRCICDTIYIPLAQMLASADTNEMKNQTTEQMFHLPDHVKEGMKNMFNNELKANGWIRAFSLKDESMNGTFCYPESNCTTLDRVSMRADWTAVGAYGGTAGAAVDAMSIVDSTFESAISLLRNLSLVTHPTKGTQPAQGIAVMTTPFFKEFLHNNYGIPVPEQAFDPAFPEFFDTPGWGGPWPRTERSVQNAEAAISDAVIRSIFGWRPTWKATMVSETNEAEIAAAISNNLWMPDKPRGNFTGTLKNVRTPYFSTNDQKYKMIDITAGADGLSWKYTTY